MNFPVGDLEASGGNAKRSWRLSSLQKKFLKRQFACSTFLHTKLASLSPTRLIPWLDEPLLPGKQFGLCSHLCWIAGQERLFSFSSVIVPHVSPRSISTLG